MHPQVSLLLDTRYIGTTLQDCVKWEPPLPGRSFESYVPSQRALNSLDTFTRELVDYLYAKYSPPAFADQLSMTDMVTHSYNIHAVPTLLAYYVLHVKGVSVFKKLSAAYPKYGFTRKLVHKILTSKVPSYLRPHIGNRYHRSLSNRLGTTPWATTMLRYFKYMVHHPDLRPELRKLLLQYEQHPNYRTGTRDGLTYRMIKFLTERQDREWQYCPKTLEQVHDILDYFSMMNDAFGQEGVDTAYGRSLHTLWRDKQNVARAAARKAAMDNAQPWPASGLKTPDFVSNTVTYRFVELTTPVALYNEGEYMHHCVAGYYRQCQKRDVSIFSMRSAANKPTVTIEVDLKRNTLRQARGKHNRDTSKTENEALLWFANINRLELTL